MVSAKAWGGPDRTCGGSSAARPTRTSRLYTRVTSPGSRPAASAAAWIRSRIAGIPFGRRELEGGDPAVGGTPGDRERARPIGPQPDRDAMERLRLELRGRRPEVMPVVTEARPRPEPSGHVDRLLERFDLLSGGEDVEPEGAKLVVGGSSSQSEDEPRARQTIEGLGHLGHHRRGSIGDTQDAAGNLDARGPGRHPREHRPRFEVGIRPGGMIVGRNEIEPGALGSLRVGHRVRPRSGRGRHVHSEEQRLAHGRVFIPRAKNDTSIAGPMRTANASVPIPTEPPKITPMIRTATSMVVRALPGLVLALRPTASMRLSRGPAPSSAPMYNAVPRATAATPPRSPAARAIAPADSSCPARSEARIE